MFEEDVRTDVQCHLPVGKVWRGTEAVLLYPVCLSEAGRAGLLARGPGTTLSLDPSRRRSPERRLAVSSRSGAADVKILASSLISGEAAVVIRFLATPPVPLGTNPSSIWQHVQGI